MVMPWSLTAALWEDKVVDLKQMLHQMATIMGLETCPV
jgi:hypothetical protein